MMILKQIKKAVLGSALVLAAALAFAETKTITILETSDFHGAIYPYDYATDSEADNGLAKAATVIKAERAKTPNLLLVDCGDNLQDNMIQEFRFDKKNPMIAGFNALGYDMHVLGNHEFNFEFKSLQGQLKQYKAPVVGANAYKADGKRFLTPYIIKDVDGVKVALIGIMAPHEDKWEANPANYDNMTFVTPMEELAKVIPEVEGKADVIVVVAHYGEDGEYGVEGMKAVANTYGDKVSAFLIGHAHSTFAKEVNGALFVEPGSKGTSVGKVEITVDNGSGDWVVTDKKASLIDVKGAKVTPDAEILKIAKKAHDKSIKMSNQVVGKIAEDMLPELNWNGLSGIPYAQVADSAQMDLINKVQLAYAEADVSMTALLDTGAFLKAGDFHKRDGVKVYKYDNTLYRVEVTGAELKKVMEEQAGNYFNTAKDGDVTISFNPDMRSYVYDVFAGVDYEINISKPAGQRIENVMYKGAPLKDDEVLILAINNYRYGTLAGKGLLTKDPSKYRDTTLAIRDLISDYIKAQKGGLKAECDNNWKITGFNPDASQAAKVYAKVKSGELSIPTSADGRTINVAPLNYFELKEQGLVD